MLIPILCILVVLWGIRRFWRDSYLNGIDAVFIAQDAYMRSTIHGLFVLKGKLTKEGLREFVTGDFIKHRRFRQRVVTRQWGWPYWKDAQNFNVDDHLLTVEARDHAELERMISRQLCTSLDKRRPLWQFVLVENYGADSSALLFRCHHSLGDGVGLMRMTIGMLGKHHKGEIKEISSSAAKNKDAVSPSKNKRPGLGQTIASGVKATGKLVLLAPDATSALKTTVPMAEDTPVNASWTEHAIKLDLFKAIAKKQGCSVNDVMFYILASATRAYLLEKGKPLPTSMQTVLWVSLRGVSLTGPGAFGNSIGAVYLKLPLRESDPVKRLAQIKEQTDSVISSPEPFIAAALMKFFGLLPPAICVPLWNAIAFKVTASMSNLPGPQFPLAMTGVPIDSFVFFVPPVRTLGHFLTVLSYNGGVKFGLASDERLVPDPQRVVALCSEQLEQLTKLVEA